MEDTPETPDAPSYSPTWTVSAWDETGYTNTTAPATCFSMQDEGALAYRGAGYTLTLTQTSRFMLTGSA